MKTRKGASLPYFPKVGDDWGPAIALLKSLPPCWLRFDPLFWEITFEPERLNDTKRLDRIIAEVGRMRHGLVMGLVPCPHPNADGWQRVQGGKWPDWMRPPWRLWPSIRKTTQMLVDHTVRGWKAQGRSIADLRFAWWNEPAKGHASGPRVGNLATGDWGEEFHRASSAILVDGGGVNFRGCMLCGPTLSFFGEKGHEERELASVTGGKNGGWWERIDRRAFNSGIYFPRGLPLSKGVGRYKTETQRRVDIMRALKVPAPRDRVDIHEWYATPGSLGRPDKPYNEKDRGEAIASLGYALDKVEGLDLKLFFSLINYTGDPQRVSPYELYGVANSPALEGLRRWLARG